MKARNTKKQDDKWEEMFKKLFEFSLVNRFEPTIESGEELAKWYRIQRTFLNSGKLRNDRKVKFGTIKFEMVAARRKWIVQYDQLLNYRKENPNSWPVYGKDNPDVAERKLSVFCQIIRKRFRDKKLEDFWIEKFKLINFNFEAGKENWIESYNRIKDIISDRLTISEAEIGTKEYNWVYRYNKSFEANVGLTKYQRELIGDLNLNKFFDTWDQQFEKAKNWVDQNGKLPTRKANSIISDWLGTQRSKYENGTLDKNQEEKLRNIGFELIAMGKEKDEFRWKEQFKKLQFFRKKNPNRWPSYYSLGEEKKLYNWCQAQRQLEAGTIKHRKNQLTELQVKMLNSIGFMWSKDEINYKLWQENYEKLKSFLASSSFVKLTPKINGETNNIYNWVRFQKQAYKKGDYDSEKYMKLRELGINFD